MSKESKGTIDINGTKYKLNRIVSDKEQDTHHIVSKKLYNVFNVSSKQNLIKLKKRTHIALNNLFGGENQTPKSQLEFMLRIWNTALSNEVRTELMNILRKSDEEFYSQELLPKKKRNGKI